MAAVTQVRILVTAVFCDNIDFSFATFTCCNGIILPCNDVGQKSGNLTKSDYSLYSRGTPGDPLLGGSGYMCLQTTRMSADPT